MPMNEILYIESPHRASSQSINKFSRLKGGSDSIQETDEIKEILDLTDEEDLKEEKVAQPPPKKQPEPKALEPEIPKPSEPKQSRIYFVLNCIKKIVLVVVILISIILLALASTSIDKTFYAVLQPGKIKTLEVIHIKDSERSLLVRLRGPFLATDECPKENSNFPQVHFFVTEEENGKKNRLKEDWILCLVDAAAFDSIDSVKKEKLFFIKDRTEGSIVSLNMESIGLSEDVCLAVTVDGSPVDRDLGVILGTILLVFLYFMIVTEVIDRTFASLITAGAALGVLALCNAKADQNELITWIDIETLALLVGMMLLVSILAESGIFDYFAVFAYKIAKGRVWALINCLSFFTAILAVFLDSVTMMLLATPVTIRLCEVLSLDPVPVLICMVLFANVGAASTPVGDPPNVIISLNPTIASSNVNFGSFTLHMFPGVIVTLIQTYIQIRILFRNPQSLRFKDSTEIKDLKHKITIWKRTAAGISPTSQDEDVAREAMFEKIKKMEKKLEDLQKAGNTQEVPSFQETLAKLEAQYPLRDKQLLIKASFVFVFVLFLFFTHSIPNFLHLSLGWSALVGAFLLLVISDRRDLEAILVRIEWSTLLFFAALFIVMECLSILGLIDLIGELVVHVISSVKPKNQLTLAIIIVVWVSGIASAFLDNIPVTTMMVKIITRLASDTKLQLPLHPLVWSLGFGACFGGNGTLIGASANVVTAGVSEQHGYKISFVRFFIICFPIMLLNLVVATIYLLIAHVAFSWHDENTSSSI